MRVKDHKNLEELARDVNEANHEFPEEKMERRWQVRVRNMMFIVKNEGSNDYKNLKTKERPRRRHGREQDTNLTLRKVDDAKPSSALTNNFFFNFLTLFKLKNRHCLVKSV